MVASAADFGARPGRFVVMLRPAPNVYNKIRGDPWSRVKIPSPMKCRLLSRVIACSALWLGGHAQTPAELGDGPIPGKPVEEYLVTVTAAPRFRDEKEWSTLVLPAVQGRPIEITCSPKYPAWVKTVKRLRPNSSLTFTVWQTKRVLWRDSDGEEEFSWESTLETIVRPGLDGADRLAEPAARPG